MPQSRLMDGMVLSLEVSTFREAPVEEDASDGRRVYCRVTWGSDGTGTIRPRSRILSEGVSDTLHSDEDIQREVGGVAVRTAALFGGYLHQLHLEKSPAVKVSQTPQ